MPQKLKNTLLATIVLLLTIGSTFAAPQSNSLNIDLASLRDSGFKLDWVTNTATKDLRLGTIQGDSFYAIDQEDFLNRFDLTSGRWIWSAPVGNKVFDIHSISEVEHQNAVYVLSDSVIYVVQQTTGNRPTQDKETGHTPPYQMKLNRLATSPAIYTDNSLVYGSSNGDTVWFSPDIGYTEYRYKTGDVIYVNPTMVHGEIDEEGRRKTAIISASSDGHVVAVDNSSVRKLWEAKLLNSVEAPITSMKVKDAEGNAKTLVLIAGTDQYLRAIDLETGYPTWKVLTQAPLVDSPAPLGNAVYQRIPNQGLAKFKANTQSIAGEQVWLKPEITGNLITTNRKGHLIVWDDNTRQLQVIDPLLGGTISTIDLPQFKSLVTDSNENGTLYAITDEQFIVCLSPRR
ncbi:MAG: PQQ-binding-like beta-propeller repeat protein [Phycisphaerales bacterium]|nr:PQQ-binding-like beta-propeller repeat protein [Phycisphaerales bacterium]